MLQKIIPLIIVSLILFSCKNQEASTTLPSTIKTENKSTETKEVKMDSSLNFKTGVRSILHDSKGNYWLGSHQEGVCLFDGKSYQYFTQEDGLSHNQVRRILEDKEGRIWFGTGNGVSSYMDGKITNHSNKNMVETDDSAIHNWSMSEDDLWFNAGNKSGVYKYDGKELNYLSFPMKENKTNPLSMTGFSKEKNGKIWIATYNAAIGYDGKSFDVIDSPSLGFLNENEYLHIRSILVDSKENLWLGNNGIGVILINKDTTIHFSKEHGLIGYKIPYSENTLKHVFEIEEDSQGNIWFGDRDTGAWKYDGQKMTHYTIDDALPIQFIWEIYEDRNGTLLIGMDNGKVYKFNGNDFESIF